MCIHRLRTSVSYSEAGMSVPTFCRLDINAIRAIGAQREIACCSSTAANNTFLKTLIDGETIRTARSSYLSLCLRIRAFHVLEQISKRARRRFDGFGMPLRRRRPHEPSSRPPCRPPRMPSQQAGTVVKEANEKARLSPIKGPRSAESTRISGITHISARKGGFASTSRSKIQ